MYESRRRIFVYRSALVTCSESALTVFSSSLLIILFIFVVCARVSLSLSRVASRTALRVPLI